MAELLELYCPSSPSGMISLSTRHSIPSRRDTEIIVCSKCRADVGMGMEPKTSFRQQWMNIVSVNLRSQAACSPRECGVLKQTDEVIKNPKLWTVHAQERVVFDLLQPLSLDAHGTCCTCAKLIYSDPLNVDIVKSFYVHVPNTNVRFVWRSCNRHPGRLASC